jgi:predicted O-methyltransferase YrrM
MAHLQDVLLRQPRTPLASPHRTSNPPRVGKPQLLLRVARRLRDNQILLSLMLSVFRNLQRVGINVSPNHYYWPIPDMTMLESREWPSDSVPADTDLRLRQQLEFLHSIAEEYGREWRFPHVSDGRGGYHYNNGFFEAVDAEVAYNFVRRYKPRRIIEIGSGYSTRVMAAALEMNREQDGAEGELITIDPFPTRVSERDSVRVMPSRVQDVPLDLFDSLGENDILFLDSSHIVSVGSDVVREYLEIIPRLNPGVLIHIHDIFLPSDYPREAVLRNLCFWSEQYILQAFLSFNPDFEILWGSSAMQSFHSDALEAAFPQWRESYRSLPHNFRRFIPTADGEHVWPSSFWMRRVKREA